MSDMAGAIAASEAGTATILVVDDNPVNLGVVGEHLEDNGYDVTVAQDGEEGCAAPNSVSRTSSCWM
jgi:CheY-like chemotaxis protein